MQRPTPLVGLSEPLSEDVCPHPFGVFFEEDEAGILESLMEPVNIDPMSASEVSERRILARLANLNHGTIILVEEALRTSP